LDLAVLLSAACTRVCAVVFIKQIKWWWWSSGLRRDVTGPDFFNEKMYVYSLVISAAHNSHIEFWKKQGNNTFPFFVVEKLQKKYLLFGAHPECTCTVSVRYGIFENHLNFFTSLRMEKRAWKGERRK